MNRLEERILHGAPVSAAEKAAWRRLASGGGEASSRRRKKEEEKISFLEAAPRLQLEYQQSEKVKVPQAVLSFLVPCRIPSIPHAQFLVKVDMPVVVQRRVRGSMSQNTVVVPQWLFFVQVWMPVVVQRQVLVGGSRQCRRAVLGQGCLARCDARLVLWS